MRANPGGRCRARGGMVAATAVVGRMPAVPTARLAARPRWMSCARVTPDPPKASDEESRSSLPGGRPHGALMLIPFQTTRPRWVDATHADRDRYAFAPVT